MYFPSREKIAINRTDWATDAFIIKKEKGNKGEVYMSLEFQNVRGSAIRNAVLNINFATEVIYIRWLVNDKR